MLLCVTTGMALWVMHGLAIGDVALILANIASLALAIPLLILKLKNDCGHVLRK
jgi:MtN3 and saliva related transmembrane protein